MNKRVFYAMGAIHAGNMMGGILVSGAPGGGIRIELTEGATLVERDPNDETKAIGDDAPIPPSSREESDGDPLEKEYVSDAALRQAASAAGIANRVSIVSDPANVNGRQVWPEFGAGKGAAIRYARTPAGSVRRMDGSMSVYEMLGTAPDGTVTGDGSGKALPPVGSDPQRTSRSAPATTIDADRRAVVDTLQKNARPVPGDQRASEARTSAKGGEEGQAAARAKAGEE